MLLADEEGVSHSSLWWHASMRPPTRRVKPDRSPIPDIPVNEQIRNEIVHRSLRGQSQREIAKQLHVSRNTIKAVLDDLHQAREGRSTRVDHPPIATKRSSLLDPYETELKELLVRYPDIPVVQVQQRLQRLGCDASYTILRQRVKLIRQSVSRGDLEPANAPGAVARVAFRNVEYERKSRGRCRTHLFVFRLVYSRRVYLHFTARTDLATTIHEHISAFEHFSGAAASIEYDNVAVAIENHADAEPAVNRTFLRFASHYGFRPTLSREIGAEDQSLLMHLQANVLSDHRYRSLDHANDALTWWARNQAKDAPGFGDHSKDRQQQETSHLIPLPNNPWSG